MRKLWQEYRLVFLIFAFWRIILFLVEHLSPGWWQLRFDFLGPNPWANFDGVHYTVIATQGYQQYEQAFFPLYPLIIGLLSKMIPFSPWVIGSVISHMALLLGLMKLFKFLEPHGVKNAVWTILLLLLYPLSFFFAAVYSESLFFFFTVSTLVAMQKKYYTRAILYAFFSSLTRLFGVCLLAYAWIELYKARSITIRHVFLIAFIPAGLILYMMYLQIAFGDALAFLHVQAQFGANRSTEALVWLPQVFWRYGKILTTVTPISHQYWVSVSELLFCVAGLVLTFIGFGSRKWSSLMVYCALVMIIPTLTGTFSSIGRYVLSAFPVFIIVGQLKNDQIKLIMTFMFLFGLIIASSLYLSGYFIA